MQQQICVYEYLYAMFPIQHFEKVLNIHMKLLCYKYASIKSNHFRGH